MRFASGVCMATLGLGVLACAPQVVTRDRWDLEREALRGSPKYVQLAVDDCTRVTATVGLPNLARALNVSEGEAPRLVCERITGAMVDGRLSYEDWTAFQNGRMTPELVRILTGG